MKIYPPLLDQIHDSYPVASSLYTLLWRLKNEKNEVQLEKEKITELYLIPWKTFNSYLRHLKKHKVLNFSFNGKSNVKINLRSEAD